MSRPLEFSVVIPTFNRLDFLKQTLDSVWAQTHTDYEVIIVDDGSTDGTMEYISSLGRDVKVLCQRNNGPGAARNLGAAQAVGNYIAFLDSDDLWLPWTLATFHKLIRQYQASILCAAVMESRGIVPILEQASLSAELFRDYFEAARYGCVLGSGMLVIKKCVFDQVGGFDESLSVGEDHDFDLRAGVTPKFVQVKSPITLIYRRHGGNSSTSIKAACAAATEILTREFAGCYSGGKVREKERWLLLGRMIRPIVLSSVKAGFQNGAWQLYLQSFVMQLRLGRVLFLVGVPLYGMLGLVTGRGSKQTSRTRNTC